MRLPVKLVRPYVHYMEKKRLSIQQISKVYSMMKERNVGITYESLMCDGLIDEIMSVFQNNSII